MKKVILFILIFFSTHFSHTIHCQNTVKISGKVTSPENEALNFGTVVLKGTSYGGATNIDGEFSFEVPQGEYTLTTSFIGYETYQKKIRVKAVKNEILNIVIAPKTEELGEVVVVGNHVKRVKESAFNVVALDVKELHNSTGQLTDVLSKAPGLKIRETGGVGSDIQLMLDGFSGKHVKVFIDGVPQEGAGKAYNLNNIPVNFAERIEIYKGVVPVDLGTDALGGVINIVTNKKRRKWFLDASYGYGSFNTHKSFVNFGQTFKNGLMYELNFFQNYSDNNYRINNKVQKYDHETNSMLPQEEKLYPVKRFNNTFHNESAIAKIGFLDKTWADRIVLSFTYANLYKEIQTGVYQDDVFGEKHRYGYSLIPSLEYRKRNLLTKGLDVSFTTNYNHNLTTNVDTARYFYNWFGDRLAKPTAGEQNNQFSEQKSANWNGTFTAHYRIGKAHTFTLNHVSSTFERTSRSLIPTNSTLEKYAVPNETRKHITGLSYRLMPAEKWNLTAFGKHYNSFSRGSVSLGDNNVGNDTIVSQHISSWGFGAAGTYYVLRNLQLKFSYEKALRLPTNSELFGDGDLEAGRSSLKPERSDNFNFNLSVEKQLGVHGLYVEGALIYRYTHDYIRRTLATVSSRNYGTYENHGLVETKGFNISARYNYNNLFDIGGTFNNLNARDAEKKLSGTSGQNSLTYGQRIPNQPYLYANFDANVYWHNLFAKGNRLTFSWDSFYQNEFPLYWENLGSASTKIRVPTQFSHNLSIAYSLKRGKYNLSLNCQNMTDEKLYDNFSLQKAGRAFYGKIRIYLQK